MAGNLHSLEVKLPCSIGSLEGRLIYPDQTDRGAGMVICPPHPLLAGTMDNNVVRAVAGLAGTMMPVLLFNYRAVGRSVQPEGGLPLFEYWHRLDEQNQYGEIIADVSQVLSHCRRYFETIHLVGYSFGAYVSLMALSPRVRSLYLITPPLAEHDFHPLGDLTLDHRILLAEQDNLLSLQQQEDLPGQDARIMTGTDHFFLGREDEVAGRVMDFIKAIRA